MNLINNNLSLNPFKPKFKTKANSSETELGLFYTNDMHGDVNRLSKFKTAHDKFLKANKDINHMTLAAGDCLFGSDKQRNSLMVKLFNLMGLDALALGNHEFAGGSKSLSESLDNSKFETVSANIDVENDSPLKRSIKNKKLVKSAVFMKGGHKFAVIGASPFNSYISTKDEAVKVKNLDETVNAINEETKKLESEGVDIIVGGHSHTEIDGVNTEKPKDKNSPYKLNLLMSKRNEPVLITQAGGMNKYAGYLNAVFDKKGVLKTDKIENKLIDLGQFNDSKVANNLMNEELGKKVSIATVKGTYAPKNACIERTEENPLANAFADAILARGKKYGAELSLYHAAAIRGGADGKITNYDVKYSMIPFNNDIQVVDMTEKDLVQVLKNTAGSLLTSNQDPQILRTSGMTYSIKNDKEYFLNGGKEPIQDVTIGDRKIDSKNPDENKKVRVILNSYLFDMPRTKDIMAKYKDSATHAGFEQEIFMDYLKDHNVIDCTNKEKRIKTSAHYSSWGELASARQEVMNALNENLS